MAIKDIYVIKIQERFSGYLKLIQEHIHKGYVIFDEGKYNTPTYSGNMFSTYMIKQEDLDLLKGYRLALGKKPDKTPVEWIDEDGKKIIVHSVRFSRLYLHEEVPNFESLYKATARASVDYTKEKALDMGLKFDLGKKYLTAGDVSKEAVANWYNDRRLFFPELITPQYQEDNIEIIINEDEE